MDSMEDRSIEHKVDHVDSMEDSMEDRPGSPSVHYFQCSNCGAKKSSKWCSDPSGNLLCNPCRIFFKDFFKTLGIPLRDAGVVNVRKCFNCGTEETSMWRRDQTGNFLCDRCGKFLKTHGTPRPLGMIRKNKYDGAVCINCQATKTNKWRNDKRGPICDTCYSYLRKNKVDRPLSLIMETIFKRQSKLKKATAPGEDLGEEFEVADTMTDDAAMIKSCDNDSEKVPDSSDYDEPSEPTATNTPEQVNGRKCSNCGIEETTAWRRDPTGNPFCDACGQYYRRNETYRPLLKNFRKKYDGAVCINCQTTKTSRWRYDKRGHICITCHSYLTRNKVDRPLSLIKKAILKRLSKSKKATVPGEPLEEKSEMGMTSDTMTGDAVTVESNNDDSEMMPDSSNNDV